MDKRAYGAVDEVLQQLQPVADKDFEKRLRKRLMAAYSSQLAEPAVRLDDQTWPVGRLALLAAALLLAIVVLTPAGRALAQQILRLGIFRVTTDPSLAEQAVAQPELIEGASVSSTLRIDPARASKAAGFDVFYPSYLPADYRPVSEPAIELVLKANGEVRAAEALFVHDRDGSLLFIAQHPFPPDEQLSLHDFPVGDTAAEQIEVGSFTGLWLPEHPWGTRREGEGNLVPVDYNVLVWIQPAEKGTNYFWLGSEAGLSKAVMLRIATSMESK